MDYGKIGFMSGSKGMAGACVLNLKSALRSGAGIVKACVPEQIQTIVHSHCAEALTIAIDGIDENKIQTEFIDYCDVIATGSGSNHWSLYKEYFQLMMSIDKPLIIDGHGFDVLDLECLKQRKSETILTPHHGEMSRILNRALKDDLISEVQSFCQTYQVYLVLKGSKTIISNPQGDYHVHHETGNPGMATAGSGDVLVGILASLLFQFDNPMDALVYGVYVHGLAGDFAKKELGETSMIASDLILYLPQAFKALSTF